MGGKSIACPRLSSAVISVSTNLWSPIIKKKPKNQKKNIWKTFPMSSCPLHSDTLCCFLFFPSSSLSLTPSLLPLLLLPAHLPPLPVLPRGLWCSSDGLSQRGEENYSRVYVCVERESGRVRSQQLLSVIFATFSFRVSHAQLVLQLQIRGSKGAHALLPRPPPPSTSIFLHCPSFAPHPSLPGPQPITVLGSPMLITPLVQLGKISAAHAHTHQTHVNSSHTTELVSKHVSLKQCVCVQAIK